MRLTKRVYGTLGIREDKKRRGEKRVVRTKTRVRDSDETDGNGNFVSSRSPDIRSGKVKRKEEELNYVWRHEMLD